MINPINPDDTERGELVPVSHNQKPQKKDFGPLKDFLNTVADYGASYRSKEKLNRLRTIVKMRNYCQGNQIGIVTDAGVWKNCKEEGDGIYFDPQLATFIDVLVSQIVKSKPKYKVRARAEHQIDKREAAKCAEELIKQAQTKLLTAKRMQREVKWNLLLAGETYRYTYFDPRKDGYGIPEPVYQNKQLKPKSKATWTCPICMRSGDVDESYESTGNPGENGVTDTAQSPSMCPDCGVKADVISPKVVNIESRSSYRYKNVGDVECQFPDALEMTVIGADECIADSLLVQRDRLIPRCVLEQMFPDKTLTVTQIPAHLEYKEALKGDSVAVRGSDQFEKLHFQETWISPAVYHNYRFPEDTKLANGQTVPAGTAGCDIFPKGCYFARVGKEIVNIYEQAIGECWSHTVNSIGSDFHGIGEWDLIELQDQKNEMRSMQMNSVLLDSTSPLLFRSDNIDGGKFPNKFGAVVPVKDISAEMKLVDIAARVPLSGGVPEAYVLDDKLSGAMQQRVGAFSTQGDAPDIKAMGTATGMALLNEHTIGRRSPMLQLRTEMEIEQGYQVLELRKKHWPEQMYEGIEKDTGGDAVRWFMESNVRGDFEIEVVQDSWMPQTDAQKRMDFREHMELIAPALQLKPELIDKFIEQADEIYGGKSLDDRVSDETEAEVRLETVLKAVEYVEQMGLPILDAEMNPEPEAVAAVLANVSKMIKIVSLPSDPMANAPLDVLLDKHGIFFKVYSEWFKSSEGRDATQFGRACVRAMCDLHQKATVIQKQMIMADELAAQAPMMEAQMQQEQQAMEAQNAQNQQQVEAESEAREMEMMAQGAEKVMDAEAADKQYAEAEKDRQFQREESERQRQHDAAMKGKEMSLKEKEMAAKKSEAKKKVAA